VLQEIAKALLGTERIAHGVCLTSQKHWCSCVDNIQASWVPRRDCRALLFLLLAVQQHGETSAGKFGLSLTQPCLRCTPAAAFTAAQNMCCYKTCNRPYAHALSKAWHTSASICILLALLPAAETCTVTVNVTYVGPSFNQILDYQVSTVRSHTLRSSPSDVKNA
jgi:hypothetical protein